MRVMLLVNEETLKKCEAAFSSNGIRVTTCNKVEAALLLMAEDKFDVVVMDNQEGKTLSICDDIKNKYGIPVMLLVNGTETNWKETIGHNVDGFISMGASGAELQARLKALSRRVSLR